MRHPEPKSSLFEILKSVSKTLYKAHFLPEKCLLKCALYRNPTVDTNQPTNREYWWSLMVQFQVAIIFTRGRKLKKGLCSPLATPSKRCSQLWVGSYLNRSWPHSNFKTFDRNWLALISRLKIRKSIESWSPTLFHKNNQHDWIQLSLLRSSI